MARYFFDVVGRSRCEHDLRGTLLSDSQEAHKWAQLLVLALEGTSGEQELAGGRVGVRGCDGGELFSVPIRRLAMALPTANSRASRLRRINAASGSIVGKLWIAVRGRSSGVKAPEIAGDAGEGAATI